MAKRATGKKATKTGGIDRGRSGGRFALYGLGAAALAGGAALLGIFANRRGWMTGDASFSPSGEGHAAPDLVEGAPRPAAGDRAPEAFRPDPTAPVSAEEREALRPATGGGPSLVNERTDASDNR